MATTMATPAFDTHQAVKNLTAAGADEPFAEAMVATMAVIVENMATKTDVQDLGKDLRQETKDLGKDLRLEMKNHGKDLRLEMKDRGKDIKALEQRMDIFEQLMIERMDSLKQHLTIRLGGLMVIGVGVLATLDKL